MSSNELSAESGERDENSQGTSEETSSETSLPTDISVEDDDDRSVGSETPSEEIFAREQAENVPNLGGINLIKEESEEGSNEIENEPGLEVQVINLKKEDDEENSTNDSEDAIRRSDALCKTLEDPLTFEQFEDPVITECGHIFDRESITKWLDTANPSCPLCRNTISLNNLKPHNETRKRLGLEEISEESMRQPTPRNEPSPAPPPAQPVNNLGGVGEDANRMNENDLSCCGMNHYGKCTGNFCLCARAIEYNDDQICCWNLFLCGVFSYYTLGSESSPETRTCCGIFYPLWLLILIFLFLFEIVLRIAFICFLIGVIILVVIIILVAIVIILIIALIVVIILVISSIITCIINLPCILIGCCCACLDACLQGCAALL